MAFDAATGQWKVEDDSVAPRVQSLVASDNPLVETAKQQGMQAGNRRGLLNSSISAGIGAGAAFAAALPIASQDASQAAAKNLATMNAGFQSDQTAQQGQIQKDLQASDATAQMDRLKANSDAEMTRLQTQLAGADAQQAKDIQAQMDRLKVNNDAEMTRLSAAAGFDKEKLAQQAGYQQEQTKLEGSINADAQARGFSYDTMKMAQAAGYDLTKQDKDLKAQMDQLLLNLSQKDREGALSQASSLIQSQDNVLQSILNNDKMDSATRSRLINDNTARRQIALDLVGQFYNVNLSWGNQASPDAAPLTYTDRPLTKAEIKQAKKDGTYQGV